MSIVCLDVRCQNKTSLSLEQRFQQQVTLLASDAMEGRESGTEGEAKAATYLAQEFKALSLGSVLKDSSYLQPFDFLLTRSFTGDDHLTIGDTKLTLSEQYFPMNFSSQKSVESRLITVGFGISAPEENYDDYAKIEPLEGKIFVIEVSSPDGVHPHSKFLAYHGLKARVKTAIEKGAAGVIFINSDGEVNDPIKDYTLKVAPVSIPVAFVSDPDLIKDGAPVNFSVGLEPVYRQGKNVIGFIDQQAAHTIIIGAHYDHLGYGQNGGSLYRGASSIHNGADDNASGTAMVLALAQGLQEAAFDKYNYLLIAFSGEEKGLLGSNYFVKNPTLDLSTVDFMINLDMVGRLDEESPVLLINGTGTSPVWDSTLSKIDIEGLKIKTTASGVGPSDHTSFYFKDIPVLHFFTGTHTDYHRPSDDPEHINYSGMVKVYQYIYQLVSLMSQVEKIPFSKTTEAESGNVPRFTVTLGVVPDYAFDGKGMRIEGVTEGKPAALSGLLGGDIVIKMGTTEVEDMMSYMQALSQFKRGDSTTVIVQRNTLQIEFKVIF